jgi:hypothetical protein
MPEYKPYLIGNMKTGLELDLEPWLLPQDAFTTLTNMYVRRGKLIKRLGYTQFDRFVNAVADEAIGSSGSTNYTGTLANIPIRAGDLSFTDGTLTITDDGDGTLSGDVGDASTINYTTGDYDITFSGSTTGAVTADYDFYPGNQIMGLTRYVTSTGIDDLIGFDTRRSAKYDTVNSKFEDLGTADAWSGGADDFFSAWNWRDRLFAVNNVDQMQVYDGSSFTELTMDIDDDTSNDVDTCLLVLAHKERLIVFRTTEDGVVYPARARWCAPGDYTDWVDADSGGQGGYVDAPTSHWIMSAGFIDDDIVVFFNASTWRLRYTGNYELPFRWERVSQDSGSNSTFSTISHANKLLTMGLTSILATDNLDVVSIDEKIPDMALDIDQSNFDLIQSIEVADNDQIFMSYPEIGQTVNNKTLCLNYQDKNWSVYDYGFSCFGYHVADNDLTWDEIDLTWDEIEASWDDRTSQAGFPTVIAGDTSGYIWHLNYSSADNGNAIAMEALSSRWNPMIDQGMKARLGYIDFMVDRDPDISFTVSFYVDHKTTPAVERTFTCDTDAESDEEKIVKRVFYGGISKFHRIKISHTASGQTPVIHYICPYFKSAGKIR